MLKLSDSRNFARTFVGLSLILGPALFLVATALQPGWADDTAAYLDEVAASPVLHQATAGLFLVGTFFLVAGMAGVMHLLRGQRVGIGQVGAALIIVGLIVISGFYVVNVIEATGTAAGLDREQLVTLLEAAEGSGWGLAFFVAFLGGITLGSILLAVGLWLRRAVPVWVPLVILASTAVGFVGAGRLWAVLSFALLVVGIGAVGVRILQLSDEEWAQWQVLPDRARSARQGVPAEPAAPSAA